MNALNFATTVLGALPGLIQSGIEISGLVSRTNASLRDMAAAGRDPTPQEWDQLNAEIARLRGELHAPVGSSNPGTPGEADGS